MSNVQSQGGHEPRSREQRGRGFGQRGRGFRNGGQRGRGQGRSDRSHKKKYFQPNTRYNAPSLRPRMAGIFISCKKGMEALAVRESYDLLGEYANRLWPPRVDSDDEEDEGVDIETSIERETQRLQDRPRWLNSIKLDVECLLFIETWRPIDPVQLVHTVLSDLETKKEKRTRYVQRLVPITRTCYADMESIERTSKEILEPFFHPEGDENPKSISYAVVQKIRHNRVIDRNELIRTLANNVGEPHTVNLTEPEVVIIAEVFKNVCGLSVIRDYNKLKKYNLETVSEEERPDQVGDERPSTSAPSRDQVHDQGGPSTSVPSSDTASTRADTQVVGGEPSTSVPSSDTASIRADTRVIGGGPSTSVPSSDTASIRADTQVVGGEPSTSVPSSDTASIRADTQVIGGEGNKIENHRAEVATDERPGGNRNGTTNSELPPPEGEIDEASKD